MRATSKPNQVLRIVGAGATAVILSLGVASTASAQQVDQHSGGVSPKNENKDSGAIVLGETLRRPEAQSSALPVTGSDLVGLAAIGLGAVAVGSTVVVGSRRRAASTPA